ncbi:hypothetical protein AB2L28_17185 [Kineococcus sp. TBRC 1896]|uniref:Barstar (Barnase inhibitor) n=1 Tax=Kineococcus mangrovi TaxID=1660183 RepID=A0ABV4I5K3_9ACTN
MTHQIDEQSEDQDGDRAHPAPRLRVGARTAAARARERARLVREQARAVRDAGEQARVARDAATATRVVRVGPRGPDRSSPDGPPASRALWIRGLLGDLWGDELPPSADPWLTLVQDALALDDEAGRERGCVVYADALHLDVLADVLAEALRAHPRRVVLLARLPVVLREPVLRQLRRLPSASPSHDAE